MKSEIAPAHCGEKPMRRRLDLASNNGPMRHQPAALVWRPLIFLHRCLGRRLLIQSDCRRCRRASWAVPFKGRRTTNGSPVGRSLSQQTSRLWTSCEFPHLATCRTGSILLRNLQWAVSCKLSLNQLSPLRFTPRSLRRASSHRNARSQREMRGACYGNPSRADRCLWPYTCGVCKLLAQHFRIFSVLSENRADKN